MYLCLLEKNTREWKLFCCSMPTRSVYIQTVYSPSTREPLLVWRLVSSLCFLALLDRLTKESSKGKWGRRSESHCGATLSFIILLFIFLLNYYQCTYLGQNFMVSGVSPRCSALSSGTDFPTRLQCEIRICVFRLVPSAPRFSFLYSAHRFVNFSLCLQSGNSFY